MHVPLDHEGREESVIDTYLEIGIGTSRVGHRLQGHGRRHSDGVAAEKSQAHEHHLTVSTSEPCYKKEL